MIWDRLSNQTTTEATDIDVVYFDKECKHDDLEIETSLNKTYPDIHWEVRNQARMHMHNFKDEAPYHDTFDAISKYPETCTAVAARLHKGTLEVIAPHGIEDLLNFVVAPTPHFKQNKPYFEIYKKSVLEKNWEKHGPSYRL